MRAYRKDKKTIIFTVILGIFCILIIRLLFIISEKNRNIAYLQKLNNISEFEISNLKKKIEEKEKKIENSGKKLSKIKDEDTESGITGKYDNKILIGSFREEYEIEENKFIRIEKNINPSIMKNNIKEDSGIVSKRVLTSKNRNKNVYRVGKNIKSYELYWPVNSRNITSEFGIRRHPILNEEKIHRGVDIAVKEGEAVYSGIDGIVTYAGEKGNYGNMIELERDDGLRIRYAHLSKITVNIGETVSTGQKIGESGNTGMSTGPHLHYEVLIEGIPVNPMRFKYRN